MEIIYFTAVAIVVYVVSDGILDLIERKVGHRLRHRSIVFFGIILVLALVSFELMDRITSS
jgi:hypothetical protein